MRGTAPFSVSAPGSDAGRVTSRVSARSAGDSDTIERLDGRGAAPVGATTGSAGSDFSEGSDGAAGASSRRNISLARRVNCSTSKGPPPVGSLVLMVLADFDTLEDRERVVGEDGERAVERDEV